MDREELFKKVAQIKSVTKIVLQLIYSIMNDTQKKLLLANDDLKALFDRYGVEY